MPEAQAHIKKGGRILPPFCFEPRLAAYFCGVAKKV
jgi:hypothetical protein